MRVKVKLATKSARIGQDGHQKVPDRPKMAQVGPKWLPREATKAQERPKTAPRPQDGAGQEQDDSQKG